MKSKYYTSARVVYKREFKIFPGYRRPYVNFPKLLIVPVLCLKNLLFPAIFMNFLCLICQFSTPQILKWVQHLIYLKREIIKFHIYSDTYWHLYKIQPDPYGLAF